MKKLLLSAMILFLAGCALFRVPPPEISDELWDEMAMELARVRVKVDSINDQLKEEQLVVQVKQPWVKTEGQVFQIITPSKIEEFPVKRKSVIAFLKEAGAKPSAKEEEYIVFESTAKGIGAFIGVAPNEPGPYMSARQKLMAAGKPVMDYAHALTTPGKISALKQYVAYTSLIDRAYKELMELLQEVRAKFKESPVYIDGFDVNLGLTLSISIHFKIKSS